MMTSLKDEHRLDAVEQLIPLAQEAGVPMTHLAIAFAIAHPGVTSAIIGPRTMEQFDDLLAGAEVTLTDEILDQIDTIVPPAQISAPPTRPPTSPSAPAIKPTPPTRSRSRRRLTASLDGPAWRGRATTRPNDRPGRRVRRGSRLRSRSDRMVHASPALRAACNRI